MIFDVYQTVALKGYRTDKVNNELQKELILNSNIVDCIIDDRKIRGIKLLIGQADNISPFTHPLVVYLNEDPYVVIDIRRLIRLKSSDYKNYDVSNKMDYNLLLLRARLQAVTLYDDPIKLKTFDNLPTLIFSRWISNAISFRLGLNPHDQNLVTIIAMGYYLNLFKDTDLATLALLVARNTYIEPSVVSEVLYSDVSLDTLDDLISTLKEKIDNIRMEKLNLPLFLTSITYGWKGTAAKEVMALCLEHPPTWVACLATALKEKNFRDSPISKIAKVYTRKNRDKEFLLRLEDMLVISEQEY